VAGQEAGRTPPMLKRIGILTLLTITRPVRSTLVITLIVAHSRLGADHVSDLSRSAKTTGLFGCRSNRFQFCTRIGGAVTRSNRFAKSTTPSPRRLYLRVIPAALGPCICALICLPLTLPIPTLPNLLATSMSRGQHTFRQSDVTKAFRAAVKAGIAVERVEIERNGKIVIVPGKADGPANGCPREKNEWDEVLQ
jgi:hypothetical protein